MSQLRVLIEHTGGRYNAVAFDEIGTVARACAAKRDDALDKLHAKVVELVEGDFEFTPIEDVDYDLQEESA